MMKSCLLSFCVFALLLAPSFPVARAQAQHSNALRKELDAALRSKKEVVLVVAPHYQKGDDENEAYGDWADRFNDFSAHAGEGVKVIRVTRAQYVRDVAEPVIKGRFATLFVKDLGQGLLYDHMVLESDVYKVGVAYLSEQAARAQGLQKVGIRFR